MPHGPPSRSGDLFDRLARRYDRGNRVMSLGQDLRWKRRAADALGAIPAGGLVLDVGAGTGDLARLVAKARRGARVVAADLSAPMLLAGGLPEGGAQPAVADAVVADATNLPFPDASLDGAVSAFLLRNLPDLPAFLREQARVLRPGARLVVLEIAYPPGWRRAPFAAWFHGIGPLAAGAATGQWAAYRYLSRSLRTFPTPEALGTMARSAGLEPVRLERSAWTGVFLLALRRMDA